MLATMLRFIFIYLNFPLKLGVKPPSMIIKTHEVVTLLQRIHIASPVL
jgi:hypothetical protein